MSGVALGTICLCFALIRRTEPFKCSLSIQFFIRLTIIFFNKSGGGAHYKNIFISLTFNLWKTQRKGKEMAHLPSPNIHP